MAGSYRMALKGRLKEVPVENVIYWNTGEADNSFVTAGEIVGQFVTAGGDVAYLDCLCGDYSFDAIECAGIVASGGGATATPTYVFPMGGTSGNRAGEVQSNQAGPMASFFPLGTTGFRARVCKVFFPGLAEVDGDEDLVAGAVITAVGVFMAFLTAGFPVTAGTVQWVARVRLAGVATIKFILGYAVETFIASQRRRRPVNH